MASVLHKTTKEYRASVNTPDYPESDWIRNPDLSAVVELDVRYWKIVEQSTPVVIGSNPETGETLFQQVVTYSVVPMTSVEQAQYDAENPIPQAVTSISIAGLDDGTPAYQRNGILVSVGITTLVFSVKVANAKKFTVPLASVGESYTAERNRVFTRISVGTKSGSTFTLIVAIGNIEYRFNVTTEVKVFDDLDIRVSQGDSVVLKIESNSAVSNPIILVDTSARN